MPRDLTGMTVIITGASAGIGRALAVQLAAAGAKLTLAARRLDRLEELNAELGGNHLCIRTDVSRSDECAALIEQSAAHFGRIDTLVCNAGYGFISPVADSSSDQMRDIFATNVFGTTDCIRAAVPIMARQDVRNGARGQLMIVSSAAARRGLPYFGAYSATKFAQLALAEALRVELKPQRIAVTSVHPIGTDTDFFTTAEATSSAKMPIENDFHQSAETVARKMVNAIRRPRPELWPMRPARIALSVSTMFPAVTDWFMAKLSRSFDAQKRSR